MCTVLILRRHTGMPASTELKSVRAIMETQTSDSRAVTLSDLVTLSYP